MRETAADRSAAKALSVVALGTLLTLVAFTAPLATVNSTAAGLGADAAGRTWILSSMSIGLGAALLSTGTIADDFGRRRTFEIGMLTLALASIASAVAPDTLVFVLARVLQGMGGAAVIASSLGIIAHTFAAGPARAAASGVWGASVGAGIAAGPLLSAGLDRAASWRDVYWLIFAAAIALGIAAHFLLPESRTKTSRRLDIPGVVLLASGMSALLAALVEGRQGWTSGHVFALAAAAAVLLLAFGVVEARSSSAMLDLTLFRQPAFVAATTAALATGAGIIALMSYMSGFLGAALQISALGAAGLLFVWSGISVVTALLARRIPPSVPGRTQLAIGLVGVGIGQFALFGISETSTWARFLPGLVIAGIASGILNAALGREAVASVPPGRAGMGSGANNSARYVGSAIGVTVVAVIAARPGSAGDTAVLVDGWNHAALVTATLSVLGALVVFLSRARANAGGAAEPQEVEHQRV
ncbi:MFS transporter [Antrihabitans sp. YC2-6]|nr:MFS transporter [Antrihabitans sp. YC2-6]